MLVGPFAALTMKNFLVGFTNKKLVLVSIDLKLNEKEHSIIPLEQIESIKISGILVKKIKITLPNNLKITINVVPAVKGIKNQKENLEKISNMFN
jgi:hypothetical protein